MLFNKKENNIVLTSRVRLARNIDGVPFPQKLNEKEINEVIKNVSDSILNSNSAIAHEFNLIKLKDIKPLERLSMIEKHLISLDLVNEYLRAAVLLNRDENVSIMINEEDHIRLQVIYNGFKVKEAYEYANKLDDLIEEKIQYAYDSKFGYLTSCPTNVGTGIRASVMIHLPALTMTKNINNILNTVTQVGMTMRGIYGEGSSAMGNIYQISNQVTLGLTEEEIINNLIAVTKKIIDQEMKTREMILEKQSAEVEDDIYRSIGILKYSRMLSSQECLNLLSKIRMGIEMDIIKDIDFNKIDELLVKVQPATLQLIEGRELDSKERDIIRAKIVRESLR
ncbi:putative ATP:guanido phosphotransferase [Caloramator mitchellensis]|uniref:Protein-arginine kinase n=1 Tax=Caloramator mitchellensis TaxID=908809 RepID=A0A0R3K1B9_CALMK|nr:protein arginine kinase [Caloramator mitchellensis]KRQ86079.1 putative ATP:guanido phosphotransferase [Caloramator mitchellensis]